MIRFIGKKAWRARLVLLLVGLALGVGPAWASQPNTFEQQAIETQVLQSFQRIYTLWREELYFELYDMGMQSTQGRLEKADFAQRMVETTWVPVGNLNPRYFVLDFRFRTLVYLTARITYANKYIPEQTIVLDQVWLMMLEDGVWKIDLVQVLRSPFS